MLKGLPMNWNLKTFYYFWPLAIVAPILLVLILFPSTASAKDITVKHTQTGPLSANPKDTFFVVGDFTKAGDKAQMFVLAHGQCKGQDCKWSAQRSEREIKITDRSKSKIGNILFYSVSIFIPKEMDGNTSGGKLSLFQAKMKGVDMPLWQIFTSGMGFNVKIPATKGKMFCALFNKGEWNDIVVKVDYGREKVKDYKYFEMWINGENKPGCTHHSQVVTKQVIKESKSHGWSSNTQQISTRYGIYRWNVGDYLYRKASSEIRKANKKKMKEYKQPNGLTSIMYPFKMDWGHEVPTLTLYYDEVRYGKSLGEVMIRDKAVD